MEDNNINNFTQSNPVAPANPVPPVASDASTVPATPSVASSVASSVAPTAPALVTKKKAPIWLFILIGVLGIAVVAVVAVVVSRGMGGNSVQKKINAAEKYLSELDYERAIASYNAAIEIDPTAVEAYLGLADVYIVMADDLVGKAAKYESKGKTDKAEEAYEEAIEYYNEALEVLEDALDNVSDSDIKKVEKKKDKVEGYIEDAEDAKENGSGEATADGDIEDADGFGGDDIGDDTVVETYEDELVKPDEFADAYVGEYVFFGSYEQDGNEANGPEPIEWEVLDINENGMLLISKYLLDIHPYDESGYEVTWENCSLRYWLNNEFINAAFDFDEQSRINTTYVVNSNNYFYGTAGGSDTYDKIFCLSVDELHRYYQFNLYYDEYGYGYCQRLVAEPTQYAVNRGSACYQLMDNFDEFGYTADIVGMLGGWWWLRTPAVDGNICHVCHNGLAGAGHTIYGNAYNNGVRPVMYVQP